MDVAIRPSARLKGASRPLSISLPQVWATVAVALPLLVTQRQFASVDLAYGIRMGEIMLRTHALIRSDTLSFLTAGRPWTDQQWGAQVVLALVFSRLGWIGLALLHTALLAATYLFVYLACRASGAPPRNAGLLTLATIPVTMWAPYLRAQAFGDALFAASLWLVAGRREHPRRLWLVPALVAAWANLHGSFFLAPMLLVLAWVQDHQERRAGANRLLAVAGAAGLCSLANPFGPHIWLYVLRMTTNRELAGQIIEWLPPTARGLGGALFFASGGAIALLFARRRQPVPWPVLLVLGVFFAMALWSFRNILLWGLVAAPAVASLLADDATRADPVPTPSIPAANALVVAIVLALVAITFPWSFLGSRAGDPGPQMRYAPSGITRELQRLLRPGERVFDAQSWGSWFELALPRNPVAFDSIIEAYPASAWSAYDWVSGGGQGWQRILARWRVDVAVIAPGQQIGLVRLIRHDPGWRLVYRDREGMILVRARPRAAPGR